MRVGKSLAIVMAVVLGDSVASRADFQYTESSKMTGGAVMGAMKFASVFSKQARAANGAQISTKSVKGNRLREDQADGEIQIIDLDGRRFIYVDPKEKTYSILTFEQMKQQMLAAQERMKQEQAKHAEEKPKSNVKVTPKIESSETGATRNILGLETKETKIRIEMLMETDDPKAKGQQLSTAIDSDSWIAPTVPGYQEVRQFFLKMAKEMDWVPGAVQGGLANSNMQVGMMELNKNNAKINGLPMLQTISMNMAGNGSANTDPGAQSAPPPPPPAEKQEPASAKDAIAQGIAGHFGLGGFGKKKKKVEDAPAADNSPSSASGSSPAAPAGRPGALMEMTVEVTAYSADTLDKSLFDVPAGYALVQRDLSAQPGKH